VKAAQTEKASGGPQYSYNPIAQADKELEGFEDGNLSDGWDD
jgi:hypothetical protein